MLQPTPLASPRSGNGLVTTSTPPFVHAPEVALVEWPYIEVARHLPVLKTLQKVFCLEKDRQLVERGGDLRLYAD